MELTKSKVPVIEATTTWPEVSFTSVENWATAKTQANKIKAEKAQQQREEDDKVLKEKSELTKGDQKTKQKLMKEMWAKK